ncbi:MAG: hypothetical protein Q8K07_00220 [Methylicorpusculum sp.]|uniref:hypothetical protein n=1 Tax=Methylicorpusculum sp. TaxID=2713644 RepID=UPI00272FF6A2|nr:hypothetical protein [Methylicorpusculum sp.]MDP2177069.1 hypothetical protein [Methylicorpusculum sp.]MDP2200421.1 hypothetical protein [Methylicorpusculum sp.]MDP3529714.1 hypothetical protein [Methylicorpusculum sp.]MDZ4150047.1 hypothetical protein [Methylicorpusculum sp.]
MAHRRERTIRREKVFDDALVVCFFRKIPKEAMPTGEKDRIEPVAASISANLIVLPSALWAASSFLKRPVAAVCASGTSLYGSSGG